jgi:hypothetical protein
MESVIHVLPARDCIKLPILPMRAVLPAPLFVTVRISENKIPNDLIEPICSIYMKKLAVILNNMK